MRRKARSLPGCRNNNVGLREQQQLEGLFLAASPRVKNQNAEQPQMFKVSSRLEIALAPVAGGER